MANKFKDTINPKLWFKNEKDRKILIATKELEGSALEKELATINEEPWVNVIQMDVDPINPKKGFVELDFNDFFVTMLQSNGYKGNSDEDTVNTWFNDLCRTILLQENADQDFGLESDRTPADVVKVTDEDIAKIKKEGK
jgi:fructoselysine-6-P-deglycase FrlB-like protein|tara:strand:- start:28 stop:447 length:420 start_codon:yes stop_codon:yes gene_type:complete